MKVKMSTWNSLKEWFNTKAKEAKIAVGLDGAPALDSQKAAQALGLPQPANQTMTGGKRYRKTHRRGGKKHRKTGKRKH